MEELKTIDNLEWRAIWETKNGGKKYAICLPRLRRNIINWIKALEKADENNEDFCVDCKKFIKDNQKHWEENREHEKITTQDPCEPHGQQQAVLILKHVFDITKEDLK